MVGGFSLVLSQFVFFLLVEVGKVLVLGRVYYQFLVFCFFLKEKVWRRGGRAVYLEFQNVSCRDRRFGWSGCEMYVMGWYVVGQVLVFGFLRLKFIFICFFLLIINFVCVLKIQDMIQERDIEFSDEKEVKCWV